MWAPRTAALSLWEEVQLLPGFGLYLEGVGNGRALSPPRLKNMGRTILELAVAVVKRDAVRRPGVDHSSVSAPARARRVSKLGLQRVGRHRLPPAAPVVRLLLHGGRGGLGVLTF